MVQLQQFLADVDLLGFGDDLTDGLLDFFGVGRTEKDVLDLLGQFFDVLRVDVFNRVNLFLLLKEKVGFVNDDAFEMREI